MEPAAHAWWYEEAGTSPRENAYQPRALRISTIFRFVLVLILVIVVIVRHSRPVAVVTFDSRPVVVVTVVIFDIHKHVGCAI